LTSPESLLFLFPFITEIALAATPARNPETPSEINIATASCWSFLNFKSA
jgi:hypothetical protein